MKNMLKRISKVGILVFILFLVSCNTQSKVESTTTTSEVLETETSEEVKDDSEISSTETTIREIHEVKSPMEVVDIEGFRDTDKSTYVEIEFTKEILDKFDATSYVKIEPDITFNVSKVNKKLIIKGEFDPSKSYKITALPGIKAVDGTATLTSFDKHIAFTQKKPKLVFTNEGIILPSVNEKKVYVRSLNVTKVNIIVRKVYANNTTQFLQRFDFAGNGNYRGSFKSSSESSENNENEDYYYYDDYDYYSYDSSNNFENVGDEIYNAYFDIENEVDTWVQSAIDLTGVIDSNGFYIIEAKFDKDGTSYNFRTNSDGNIYYEDAYYIRKNGNIRKTILLTNMAIIADKNDDGYRVNVLDIVENRLMRGVKLSLMSKNNQVLEEKTTDEDGTVNFSNHKNAFYILADDKLNKSILMLKNALNMNGFAVDGDYETSGIRGFIYTERGVYRPGDPVYVSIIARNNNEALLDSQPVKITIYDPTGSKMVENDVIKNGKNGFYTYTFKTDVSSKTGIWKLEATIGDKTFSKDISIETVVPNKIRVNLDVPDSIGIDEAMNTDFAISSNYLFGSPAGSLDYFVSFSVREEPIEFEKYKDYTFKLPSSYGYSDYSSVRGKLNEEGVGVFKPDFSDVQFGSINMLVDVSGRVTDDGGRNVTSNKYLKLKKYDTYIGIENTNTYRKPGSKLDLKVISVTEDGESLVPNKKLKYRIYANDHYWWWDYSDYDNFIRSFKSDKNTTLVYEGDIITSDVPVLIDYETPNIEYLYVEIEDEMTGQLAGVNLEASEWVDPSVTKKIETLNISTDKKKYNVGDTAQIKYKGTEKSKAIITIEKAGKIINQYSKDVNAGDIIEEIAITKEMTPNAYVYVTLIQNYLTKENDRPLRLYGVVPINVEDADTKIDLEIVAPEEVRPNEKFVVKVKNKSFKQVDFTIAVVDEGLLDITQFKTPNPFEYFFKKIAAKLKLYDNYSEIIDRPYGAINQILKVGGDESLLDEMARRRRLKELGLEEADRFTPVSMFKGVLTTDVNGDASIDFDMPNYMGQVRIMVIAACGMSYGSAEKDMLVKAPIIVDPTLPRNMKIGDKMNIPITVFALEDGIGDINVYYTFKGKTQNKNTTLEKGKKETVYFEEEIGNEVGSEKLTVGVKSRVYNYEETVGMAINSNNTPIETSENKEIKGRGTIEFTNDKEYVSGTVDSTLTISNTMMLGLDQRLKYLIRYPYGCVEQTTSSVFPQLFIDKLSTSNFDKAKIVDNINAGISRLKLFQLNDGSFSYWPGDNYTSEYGTNYVAHFLIMARKNGYYVPDSMYDNMISYLSKKVRTDNIGTDYDVSTKCYALYLLALAGKQNVSEMNYMYENYFTKNMDYTSKMYLAAAYKLVGEDNIAISISNDINVVGVKKMFDDLYARDRHYYTYSYGSKLREVAVYLNCYHTIFGKRDDAAFEELLGAMRTKSWYSTQTTSYSLLALSNVVTESVGDEVKGVVEIDGVKTEYSVSGRKKIAIGENVKSIKITSDTDKMTYVNYYVEGVPINEEVEDYSEGFSITRNYYDNDGKKIDVAKSKSGDVFWMEVVVSPTKRNMDSIENIALTQILPTGWEIENTRVNNTSLPSFVEEKTKETKVSYTDIRDDRIMWFFDYNEHTDYKFFVKINAVTKGEFDFPGTVLEAMYDYDYRAFKKGGKVVVE